MLCPSIDGVLAMSLAQYNPCSPTSIRIRLAKINTVKATVAFVLFLNTNFTIQALFTIADSYLTLYDYTKALCLQITPQVS